MNCKTSKAHEYLKTYSAIKIFGFWGIIILIIIFIVSSISSSEVARIWNSCVHAKVVVTSIPNGIDEPSETDARIIESASPTLEEVNPFGIVYETNGMYVNVFVGENIWDVALKLNAAVIAETNGTSQHISEDSVDIYDENGDGVIDHISVLNEHFLTTKGVKYRMSMSEVLAIMGPPRSNSTFWSSDQHWSYSQSSKDGIKSMSFFFKKNGSREDKILYYVVIELKAS